jgi:hypothetical protein
LRHPDREHNANSRMVSRASNAHWIRFELQANEPGTAAVCVDGYGFATAPQPEFAWRRKFHARFPSSFRRSQTRFGASRRLWQSAGPSN